MLFVELRFFFFFLLVFGVYWTLRSNTARKVWLLLVSYCFYAAWDWRFVFILLASTSMDYVIGRVLESARSASTRRWCVGVSLVINLGLLGFFKYCNFFITSASALLDWLGLHTSMHTLEIVIPVGLSFYTFQSMSYTLEVYRRHMPAERNVLDLATFIAFFPQLVAGPIVRALHFLPQLKTLRRFADVDVRAALVLFLIGFIKKAVIAEGMAPAVDRLFASPEQFTALSIWIGVVAYAIQIYCDFSGYTDMANATARLLGYDLALNFHFPYLAENITQFWRRWHISLSTWLRDYLYISLGGNRGTKLFVYRNLMLTMLLGGLWHGGAWTFVIWGGLHGLALVVHREWTNLTGEWRWLEKPMRLIRTPLTFYWVCIAWVFFRATDLKKAGSILNGFMLFQDNGNKKLSLQLLSVFASLAVLHWINSKGWISGWWRKPPDPLFAAGYGCAVAVVLLFLPAKYSPFIYFQF